MQSPDLPPSARHPDQRCVKRLRIRLARWELPHLRALAAELHTKLEEAERRADNAEDQAQFWWDHSMRLQEDWQTDHPTGAIGLTQAGELVLMHTTTGEVQQ